MGRWGIEDAMVTKRMEWAYREVEVDRATLATFCVNMAGRAAPANPSVFAMLQFRGIAFGDPGQRTTAESRHSHPLRDHVCFQRSYAVTFDIIMVLSGGEEGGN